MYTNTLLTLVPALITALGGFITAIAGAIPILSVAKTNREARVSASPESPSLQFLKVKQTPLEKENWQKFKKFCLFTAIISMSFVAIIIGSTIDIIIGFIFFGTFSYEVSHIILGSFSAVIVIINFVIYTRLSYLSIVWYIEAGKNPEDARYVLFQETKIVGQSDYRDIFFRCKEKLNNLSTAVTEYDFETGSLEAYVSVGLKLFKGILSVKIDQLEKSGCLIQIKFTPRYFNEFALATSGSSWIVNQFIRQIEGK